VFDPKAVEMVRDPAIEVQLERMGFGIAQKIDSVRPHRHERQDGSVDFPSQGDKVHAPLHGGTDARDA